MNPEVLIGLLSRGEGEVIGRSEVARSGRPATLGILHGLTGVIDLSWFAERKAPSQRGFEEQSYTPNRLCGVRASERPVGDRAKANESHEVCEEENFGAEAGGRDDQMMSERRIEIMHETAGKMTRRTMKKEYAEVLAAAGNIWYAVSLTNGCSQTFSVRSSLR